MPWGLGRNHQARALFASGLEQLAIASILSDGQRACVFERRFIGLSDESPVIGMYSDCRSDPEAERLLEDLRRAITANVPADNRFKYEVQFRDGIDLQDSEHKVYLRQLLDDMCTAGLKAIDKARANPVLRIERNRLVEESELHLAFAAERARRFCSTGPSSAALRRVTEYLGGRGGQPMVVYGPSGAGKTYVMAKAAAELVQSNAAIIVRFLGISQDSATVPVLLPSLCEQLRVLSRGREGFIAGSSTPEDLGPVPADFDALCTYFMNALINWRPSWGQLLLLLDSVDQLDDTNAGRRLDWLPFKFSDQVMLCYPLYLTLLILNFFCFLFLGRNTNRYQ